MSHHDQLLKEIEGHLEKLASAHTVLSDAIENEKRAGLITAALSAEKALAPHIAKAKAFAKPATDRIAAATTNEKRVAGGVALTGAFVAGRATAGSGQDKQASMLKGLSHIKDLAKEHSVEIGVGASTLAIGAASIAGVKKSMDNKKAGQNKQAAEDSEHTGYKPHYLRNMAIGAGVAAVPGLLRAKSLNGVIAKSKSSIEDLVKERRAVLDHTDSGLYAESTKFNANMAKVDDLKTRIKGEQGAIDSLNTKKRDTLKAAGGAGVIGSYVAAAGTAAHSDHKNRDELYQPRYGRNVAIATGLTSVLPGATLVELGLAAGGTALATKLNSMRHAYREKRASEDDSDNGGQVGRYLTVGGLSGAALAAPDAVRALKSLSKQKAESKGYDTARGQILSINEDTNRLDMTSPNYQRYKAYNEEHVGEWTKYMKDHKYNHAAASDFTDHMAQSAKSKFKVGGAIGLAAVGAKQLWDANHQKQASDQDQDQYSPHYVRNAILTGGALAAPDAARAYSSTAKGLDHRETFHEHSALSKRYLAEGDLINAAKYADSANKHKALAHEADLYTHNLGGSIGKKLATGAALATAVTGVNHIMHSGQTKSASLKAILQALETC